MKIKKKTLIKVDEKDIKNGIFSIPKRVTKIGNGAFLGCESLKEIHIPDSVTEIGEYAFLHCVSLKDVYIPDSVEHIRKSAFSLCYSLEKIRLSENITVIEKNTFKKYGREFSVTCIRDESPLFFVENIVSV